MSGDGMVAVVRELETGLAITVIDGNKRYTLAPTRVEKNDKEHEVHTSSNEPRTVCESTVQAVDGRYTSTYQMQHCNVTPTSPPVMTTEFPPQRPTLCPGQGNFEVGGSGSGETYAVTTKTNKFRGAMNWPDRDSVCSPRGTHEVDIFANSLRKYPISPDKSSEMVEKIVNYAMDKNGMKAHQPTRLVESETLDPRMPLKARPNPFASRKLDVTPTKLKKDHHCYKEFRFPKEYDIRFLRNISKRAREFTKNACTNSATHANSEIQAAVKMVSREVSTDPRPKPTRRTIAVPLSPTSSTTQSEGIYDCPPRTESFQNLELNLDCPKHVQTISSCVQLDERNLSVEVFAKTRSEENIANIDSNLLKNDIEWVEDVPSLSEETKDLNNLTLKGNSKEFFKNINLEVCKKLIRVLECDLVDVLTYFVGCLRNGKDAKAKKEMKYILKECDKLTDKQADNATRVLINNLKDVLKKPTNSKDCVVLSSSVHAIEQTENCTTVIKENKQNNLDEYTQLFSQEIEEWLENSNIANSKDAYLKQDIKKLITLDIIDKYKDLNSNSRTRSPESNEIERLKFEIYKCMNNLVGESYTEILQYAEELLAKIRCLPLPVVTRIPRKCSLQDNNTIFSNCKSISTHSCLIQSEGSEQETKQCTEKAKQCNSIIYDKSGEISNESNEISSCKSRKSARKKWQYLNTFPEPRQYNKAIRHLATPKILSINLPSHFSYAQKSPFIDFSQKQLIFRTDNEQPRNSQYNNNQNCASSLKELNEEYDDFIKEWVEKIPIVVTSAEDQKLAGLARLGIFNGIWKAITKLNLDPNAHNNSYYYQDILDDEIEDLLSNLPQTAELVANKHRLKAQLLEKTRIMNENIKSIILPSCFKQQLMECLDNHLPKISVFDPLKETVNVHKLLLVEDYILLIRFIDEDNVKSNVYKDSLLKRIAELADITKKNHKEKDSNSLNYISEIVNALSNVPIPDRKNLEDEANEILLGNEVTGWLCSIPLCDNLDVLEIRRYRNKLVKKILEIEKQQNLLNNSAHINLREDIRKQLRTIAFQADDINLVMEEIINRLKKMSKIQESKNYDREESENYEDFRRSVPGCSTFMNFPDASDDGNSYMVVGGDIVKQATPKYLQPFKEPTESKQNWLSMELTKRPQKLDWSQSHVTGRNQQIIEQPHPSLQYGHSVFEQNSADTKFPREYSNFSGQSLSQPYEYGQSIESNKTVTPWNDIVKQNYNPDPLTRSPPSPNYTQEKQQSRHGSLSCNQPLNNYQNNWADVKMKNCLMSSPNNEPPNVSRGETVIDNADVRRFILDKITQPSTSNKSSPGNSVLPARLPPETSYMDVLIKTEKQSIAGVNKDNFSTSGIARTSGVRPHPYQEHIDDNDQFQKPNLLGFRNEEYINNNQEQLPSWDANKINPHPYNNSNNTINDRNQAFGNLEYPSHSGQPIGFSTPLQPINQGEPRRPRKRYQARVESIRSNNVKRKLKMEESDYDSDNESDELSCFCLRSHRRDKSCLRVVPSCEDLYLDIPHCISDRMIACPHFY